MSAGPGSGPPRPSASGRRRGGLPWRRAVLGRWGRVELAPEDAPAADSGGRRQAFAYGVAVAAVAAAFTIDVLAEPILERAPLMPFLCAIVVVAWYGGARPTYVALALASFLSLLVLRLPVQVGPSNTYDDSLRVVVFVVSGGLAGWLTVGLRAASQGATRDAAAVRRSRVELLTVLDSAAYPIAAVDRQGLLLFANAAAAEFFGTTEQRTLEQSLAAMLRGETLADAGGNHPSGAEHPLRRALRGEKVNHPLWWLRLPTGDERWISIRATPIRDDRGSIDAVVVAWRDATLDKEAEVAREAFMGVLAHELRTPITTIFGGAHLLATRSDRLPASTRREIARDVLHEATRLNRIADNLLVLSRVERGQLQIVNEPMLLEPLIRAVVESEAARWPETRFEIEADSSARLPVAAAAGYVEQVLRNLLSNAAKYGPRDGLVRVRVALEDRAVTVRVADEGAGFDPADAERLFELYYRSPANATKAPGSGIGLYVCRRLIEAMGGRIWAGHWAAGGAEFVFALPLVGDAVGVAEDEVAVAR